MSEGSQRPAGTKRNTRIPLIILLAAVILLTVAMMIFFRAPSEKGKTITYSMYPYLPDTAYCAEVLEEEWAKVHPDVKLEYMPYNCYHDGKPEGVDVVMYDSMLERMFIEKGYLCPLDISGFSDTDDFYPFTLAPADGYTEHYGMPVFLCCDLMIYDKGSQTLSEVDDIFDAAASGDSLLISLASYGDSIYMMDAAADIAQDADVIQHKEEVESIDVSESKEALTDAAVPKYKDEESNALATLYDEGAADGYIGYPETMRFLDKRIDQTAVRQIGIGGQDNIPLFYCDMAGIASDVPEDEIDLSMDLIRIMTDTAFMERVSVQDGRPQYLMFPRRSFYEDMEKEYPVYTMLKTIAENDDNELFRAYGLFMDETF